MTQKVEIRPAQDIIKTALRRSGFSETWLAEKLHMKVGTLNSRLNTAKTFPHQLYVDIMEIFKKYEIVSDDSERCKMVAERINEWSGVLGGSMVLMSKTVADTLMDGDLSTSDRSILLAAVKESRSRTNAEYDKIERLLEE